MNFRGVKKISTYLGELVNDLGKMKKGKLDMPLLSSSKWKIALQL